MHMLNVVEVLSTLHIHVSFSRYIVIFFSVRSFARSSLTFSVTEFRFCGLKATPKLFRCVLFEWLLRFDITYVVMPFWPANEKKNRNRETENQRNAEKETEKQQKHTWGKKAFSVFVCAWVIRFVKIIIHFRFWHLFIYLRLLWLRHRPIAMTEMDSSNRPIWRDKLPFSIETIPYAAFHIPPLNKTSKRTTSKQNNNNKKNGRKLLSISFEHKFIHICN